MGRRARDPVQVNVIASLVIAPDRRILVCHREESGDFIPIDDHARVEGLAHVYAAGDVTSFPFKHGSLAAQQATQRQAERAQRDAKDKAQAAHLARSMRAVRG